MNEVPQPQFGTPIAPFHKWFAWYPIKTYDHRIIWLRPVWRRRIQKHQHLNGGPNDWWQYSLNREGSFQERVQPWLLQCFGVMIAGDKKERNHRFLEEALELVQACGCTQSEAHQLVDYVYGRPIGEPHQEVGGVMVTLAALCLANDLDMHENGETELKRIWGKIEKIRAKQAAKPKHSPLPEEVS